MRPLHRLLLVACLAPALASHAARAQSGAADPRTVADSFFQRIADERFRDAAQLMDVEAFDAHRRQSLRFARQARQHARRMTAADFRKGDPSMPRAVAEYQAKQFNQRIRTEPPVAALEFGYQTLDSLERASPEDALTRWLEAHDMRYQMRRAMAERARFGCPPATRAELERVAQPVHLRPSRIIGVVIDGDSVAWVLHDEPAFDASLVERMYLGAAVSSASAVPLPTKTSERPWDEMPPSITVLRLVHGRWVIGNAIGFGTSSGFASFCQSRKGDVVNAVR